MSKMKLGLLFPPEHTEEPIITKLVKQGLSLNILKASISQGNKGKMILEVTGTDDDIAKGIDYLEGQDISIKVYTNSVIRYEEKCMHCGACTAVCPSGALVMNTGSWELEFDMDKCVLCGHCISACPARAIKNFEEVLR
ncbi:MAG: 4Fe-4S binding protein [Clostridia bacterium]|jgi:L-aspartate semialdehyde sulfurtransferase ferredoxin|nr:4Fe-4S binding protein [Clostridia bacterium]MBT7121982.1 4Fe-4S binding protein [Clostridia bacterium]